MTVDSVKPLRPPELEDGLQPRLPDREIASGSSVSRSDLNVVYLNINISSTGTITIRMSNLRTPTPVPTCTDPVTANDGQGTPLTATETPKIKRKCLVLSLIRHGQVRLYLFH
jgi:hypothetical protein